MVITLILPPTYISKGKGIVFARSTEANDISLWRLQDNKEECISKDIKLHKIIRNYSDHELRGVLDIFISQ